LQKEMLKYEDIEKEILEEAYHGNPELECLRNFAERMNNLAPFVCMVKRLSNMQKYPDFDLFSLGVGVMLYVLENMLIGKEECSIDEISDYLQTQIFRVYQQHMTQEDTKELAFYIRDAITGGGENYQFEYMNLENGMMESVPVRLMDISYYEIKKTSKYKLTDQGMEMLFKTREIFTEFRLNVTQLYLRQQIEKGVFVGALQTVNELSLQVRQLRERIEGMMEGIRQNVFSVEFEGLKKLLERIQEQFGIERREFANIKHILNEQKRAIEGIDYGKLTNKDLRAMKYIQIIAERIGLVTKEHDRLFNEKIDIIGEYLRMLEYMMKAGITDFMDYEHMVLDRLGNGNLPIEGATKFFSPLFMNRRKNKSFSLLKVLDAQNIRAEEEDFREVIDYEEELEQQEKGRREEAEARNWKIEGYLERILEKVLRDEKTTLKGVIEGFEAELVEQVSKDFDFYSLVVMLHQRKELDINELATIGQSMVYDTAYNIDLEFLLGSLLERNPKLKELGNIEVIAENKVFIFENGNRITDFRIGRVK